MQKHRLSSVTLGLFFSQGLQSLIVDVGHHGCPTKKILDFKWSKKAEITLETISFLVKYFYQYFQIFSVFINKMLSIFQNLLALWQRKRKNTHAAVNEKRKSWILFYNRLFYKAL